MDLRPEDFNHPYSPYDIQLEFMRALYNCLEERKVAIFESPTGTRNTFQGIVDKTTRDEGEPEWMLEFAKRESSRAITDKKKELEERLANIRQEEEKLRAARENLESHRKRQKTSTSSTDLDVQNEDYFALDDYDSENEDRMISKQQPEHPTGLSASTLELLEHFQGKIPSRTQGEDDGDDCVKIFYCSRTHSQLTQFVSELRRIVLPSSIPKELELGFVEEELEERVKHLPLGSRKNLCINPRVASLENQTSINERCLDLQQPGVAAERKCPFLPSKKEEVPLFRFRDHALATVRDIEDLGKLGKKIAANIYYTIDNVRAEV
ncbi:hypothetical protein EYZ11_005052 [Aspergillus tanneri]|uniref:ATP-dependent DNA helicase CHL1 n=1 Tax=Aspergillus tanneri TaxID=1220188 RepID=A0A4S3JLB0_9EURO|nr:hypothetical protein EYZ11_005052 [Aspergillus tanneri]